MNDNITIQASDRRIRRISLGAHGWLLHSFGEMGFMPQWGEMLGDDGDDDH